MVMPDKSVTVYRKSQQVGKIDYFGDKLFVSPDKKYFLTVSNSGLCKIAYVLFDASGAIIRISFQDTPLARLLVPSLPSNEYPVVYHEMSVVINRTWFNEENPKVSFLIDGGILQDVTINDSLNRRVSLLEKYDFVKAIGDGAERCMYGNAEIRNHDKFKMYEVNFSELVKTNSIKTGKYLLEFQKKKKHDDLKTIDFGVAFLGNRRDIDYDSCDKYEILVFNKDRALIDSRKVSFGTEWRGNLAFSTKGYIVNQIPEYIIWSVGPVEIKK